MNEAVRKDLLATVNGARATAPWSFTKPTEVEAGQVRQLVSYDDSSVAILVMVLSVDPAAATAKVVAVGSPAADATVRDLVIDRSQTGFPFDLLVRSDGPATAWAVQLAGTRMVGNVKPKVVELAIRAARLSSDELAEASTEAGVAVGLLRPRVGDQLWWRIGRSSDKLARLTAECHEAMITDPVADPAILPSLVLRGSLPDKAAASAMGGALDRGEIDESPETWEYFDEALAKTQLRDQDTLRILQRHFLERSLKGTGSKVDADTQNPSEYATAGIRRDIPPDMERDPLLTLLSRSARAGNRSTRVWTARHLWGSTQAVRHAAVGEGRHTLITEFQFEKEEVFT
jgi:hypothetical protein